VETPMAYADGVVYAPVLNLPTVHSPTGDGAYTGNQALNFANEQTQFGEGTSELVALDAATGEILWTHPFEMDNYGGATVVNDLVFTATFDGMIYALDRATGEEVWSYQAPGGINAWPAVVGDTIIWAAGFGDTPTLIALRLGET
jgi:outer membrane protein assembly factor BamB